MAPYISSVMPDKNWQPEMVATVAVEKKQMSAHHHNHSGKRIGFAFFLINVLKRLSQTIRLFMQAAPDDDIANEVREKLLALNHIADIHHLHFWSLDGEHHVLTAHLLLDTPIDNIVQSEIKQAVKNTIAEYDFSHTTIELEQDLEACRDE